MSVHSTRLALQQLIMADELKHPAVTAESTSSQSTHRRPWWKWQVQDKSYVAHTQLNEAETNM